MKRKTNKYFAVKKASLFLPAFFIWIAVYAIVDYMFKTFHIEDKVFFPLDYGYDFSLKTVVSFVLQVPVLTVFLFKFSKDTFIFSFFRAFFVSVFLYIFLYILLTGLYLRI